MKYLCERRFGKFRATEPNEENLDISAKLAQESKKNDNMVEGSKVTLESKKEGKLELIAEHSILLPNKNDVISIKLPPPAHAWAIKFLFTHYDDVKDGGYKWELTDNNNTLLLQFNKWYTSTWTENSTPYVFNSADGKFQIHIKMRTTALESQAVRSVIINIWLKLLSPK
jgi:hypothetical protein